MAGVLASLAIVSPRARTRLVVALLAAASAALVVGVTVHQTGDGAEPRTERNPRTQAPPLELGILLRDDSEAQALRAAEQALDRGRRESARRQFEQLLAADPASIEAAVGAAIAAWPDGTLARLRRLVARHPGSGVARLHLGFALLASGDEAAADQEWLETERRDPDSPAALRAEDILHPEMAPGRPPFVGRFRRPPGLDGLSAAKQLALLEKRARRGGPTEWLLLGTAYQRVGRPLSAERAFVRAAALNPDDVSARTAAAVGRFDKDDPSQTFSRLGPLASANPEAAVARYHLGLCLSWLGAVGEAKRQLGRARAADPGGFYGREARRLLDRLGAVGT
jgi:tetratricopeptide (TPR) repeat protein